MIDVVRTIKVIMKKCVSKRKEEKINESQNYLRLDKHKYKRNIIAALGNKAVYLF